MSRGPVDPEQYLNSRASRVTTAEQLVEIPQYSDHRRLCNQVPPLMILKVFDLSSPPAIFLNEILNVHIR
jgi:hypothetical protein